MRPFVYVGAGGWSHRAQSLGKGVARRSWLDGRGLLLAVVFCAFFLLSFFGGAGGGGFFFSRLAEWRDGGRGGGREGGGLGGV